MWLDERQRAEVTSLDNRRKAHPVPTRMISNGGLPDLPGVMPEADVALTLDKQHKATLRLAAWTDVLEPLAGERGSRDISRLWMFAEGSRGGELSCL